MKGITSELWETTTDLFPTRRESRMIAAVICLAVTISVSEILMANFFTILVLPAEPRATKDLVILGIIFLILFLQLRTMRKNIE